MTSLIMHVYSNHLTLPAVHYFNVKKRVQPSRMFSSLCSYLRSPVLQLTDVDVNDWIHFVEHTSSMVLEITIHQVKSKMSCCGNSDNHLRLSLYHLLLVSHSHAHSRAHTHSRIRIEDCHSNTTIYEF